MIKWNKIYCGDNIIFLQKMFESKLLFDLIIADAPYCIGKSFGNDSDKLPLDEFLQGVDDRLALLQQLLTDQGSIILFCTHRFIGDIQFLMRKYFQQRRLMIWHYENGMSRQEKEPVTEYEPFWWFSKSDVWTYNIDDVRVPYKSERVKNPVYKKDAQGNKKAWLPNPKGKKRGDVWCYPVLAGKHFEKERTEHPTQKPVALFTDLLCAFLPKENNIYTGRVLDPFIGSGTTAVCCEQLNKREHNNIKWVGIELEEKWCNISNKRIQEVHDIRGSIDLLDEQ